MVGPSLAGIATRAASRIEGMDPAAYIRQSILDPDAYVVDGFQKGLMVQNLADELSSEQLDAVVGYLMTLQ